MTTRLCVLFVLLAMLAAAPSLRAQDIASGPEVGQKVPALKVFDATGPHKDKDVDYAADRKDQATIYVFVQADKWDRPMARFVKVLDDAVKDVKGAYVVAVWLTDNVAKAKDYLPLAQQSLQLQATALTVFAGDKAGPKDWGVNSEAHISVVVANQAKAAARFGYRSINETDVPAVRDALKKALAGK